MRRLDFTAILPAAPGPARRLVRRTRPTLPALAAAALAAYLLLAPPQAELGGQTVAARRILVLADLSGSVSDAERAILKRQLARLERADIDLLAARVGPDRRLDRPVYATGGFGFKTAPAGGSDNFLLHLETAVGEHPEADAVYLFSDFEMMSDSLDSSDAAGYARLRDLVARRGMRLYASTVQKDPPPELLAIVRASGGDVVRDTE